MSDQRKPGSRWRHVKRGSTYTLIGEAHLQTGKPIDEPAIMVVYRADSDGEMWVRPRVEFLDGRFEALAAHPPGEVSEDAINDAPALPPLSPPTDG